ncbi:hypothetical protein IPM09_01645 [Candidatus Saccharibacteria bacterium]|nr:MAG: hypothetical protein IPM09_01645 [Candidatus Saccharibacteria bacterium]
MANVDLIYIFPKMPEANLAFDRVVELALPEVKVGLREFEGVTILMVSLPSSEGRDSAELAVRRAIGFTIRAIEPELG